MLRSLEHTISHSHQDLREGSSSGASTGAWEPGTPESESWFCSILAS